MNETSNAGNLKDEAKETLGADFSELKNSFGKLRSDMMTLVNDALGVGKKGAESLKESAHGSAVNAYDSAKEHAEDWQIRGEEQIEAIARKIGDKPVLSALIALGVGFVLGKLISRR